MDTAPASAPPVSDAPAIERAGGRPPAYRLVWADEFNRDGLPDTTRWAYDTSMNRRGWANSELQYYAARRLKNARQAAGRLMIEAHREEITTASFPDGGGQHYSSARLVTRGHAEWTYGFFEVRARLPCGTGTWPAIWMLSAAPAGRWPEGGEIDIMEHVGFDPNMVHFTVHTKAFNHQISTQRNVHLPLTDVCGRFHRYQLHWTADAITMGADDREYFRFRNDRTGNPATWPFDRPQYLLLNLAVGGSWGGQKGVDDNAFPARMEVDYVRVYQAPEAPVQAPRYSSTIMTYDMRTGASMPVHRADGIWEAPNWSRDGRFLLSNSGGRLYRVPLDGATEPEAVGIDPSLRCNNDHDFSPDGRFLAISASSPASRQSQVYITSADGSAPRQLVVAAPSYFHGWSPDGRYVAIVANRDGRQYDLYRVPAAGGPEERLTFDSAHDDGPDYSPDGRWIYFNSGRGGGSHIWRMPAEGAGVADRNAERITGDDREDWFPHPSPDGKSLIFLSLPHGTEGHNERGLRVQLRIIALPGDRVREVSPRVLATFTGGQGTINVNSWSPDSRRFAYVTYQVRRPTERF